MHLMSIDDLDLAGKTVLIREDLNVPIKDGIITSDQRIQKAFPTIEKILKKGAKVLLLSHLGRPTEGRHDKKYSLAPVADYLAKTLRYPVRFETDYLEGVSLNPGELVVCENVRFNPGELANETQLAKKLAKLCDVFVMDAFGTAHRAHASTVGVAKYAPIAVAGPLLMQELKALDHAFQSPKKPIVAVVGGSKISTKLSLLKQLVTKVDYLILGGGIANTFLKAKGYDIGYSLYEEALLDEAVEIMALAVNSGCELPLPKDVVVGKVFSETCPAYNKQLSQIAPDDMIMDIGPETIKIYEELTDIAKTIIWNGPMGVFEFPQFAYGTRAIAIAIANADAFSVAGGGDTLAAIDQYDLAMQIDYVSTGGGAFLEFLEGKKLPAVAILEKRAVEQFDA